jgi:hypothetical protein
LFAVRVSHWADSIFGCDFYSPAFLATAQDLFLLYGSLLREQLARGDEELAFLG